MPLVTVVLTLVVVGVLLWLVNLIPMQSQIKGILNTIVVIAVSQMGEKQGWIRKSPFSLSSTWRSS